MALGIVRRSREVQGGQTFTSGWTASPHTLGETFLIRSRTKQFFFFTSPAVCARVCVCVCVRVCVCVGGVCVCV